MKKFKTTLYVPEELWKRAKIRAIELDIDATDLVTAAIEQFLKKGDAR